MKNISIVIGSSNVGGAEKQALLLASLLSQDFTVSVIFLGKPGPMLDVDASRRFEVFKSSGTVFGDHKVLFSNFRKSRPVAVINYLYRADILSGAVARFLQVPVIINSARNTNWPRYSRVKWVLIYLSAIFFPKFIVANSQNAADWHQSIGYPSAKFRVIPNFLDEKFITVSQANRYEFRQPLRLGIASRAVEGKGHLTLIRAASLLRSRGIQCELFFIGFGIPDWDLLNHAKREFGLPIYTESGRLDLLEWFKEIDIYCGISEFWESDSNSINEAVLVGLPVVATSLLGIFTFTPSLETVKPNAPDEVADSIEKILTSNKEMLRAECAERRNNLISDRDKRTLYKEWLKLILSEIN